MKTDLKKTLERAMEEWVMNECDHEERPEPGLLHPELGLQMAQAAAAVYDATFAAQKYQELERFENSFYEHPLPR